MAVVMCKGLFHDSEDPALQDTVCYSMAVARVPDCIPLISFHTLREAFKEHNACDCMAIGLMRYHAASRVFPDVYFHYYQQHLTIVGLEKPELVFGAADEFIASYLIQHHQITSEHGAHAMLPPGYRVGATSPIPSATYVYSVPGTGVLGQHPPIHSVYIAPLTEHVVSPGHFCLGKPLVSEWHFNDSPIPWIFPDSYRNPSRPDPNSCPPLPMQIVSGGPDMGTTIQIADIVDATGIRPSDAQEEFPGGDGDGEDTVFVTVEEPNQTIAGQALAQISAADIPQPLAPELPVGSMLTL